MLSQWTSCKLTIIFSFFMKTKNSHDLLGLAPNSLDLTPGKIWLEIISSLASRVLFTLIFPLYARISIPPVLKYHGYGQYWTKMFNFSPIGREPVVGVKLDLAVLVNLSLVLGHRLSRRNKNLLNNKIYQTLSITAGTMDSTSWWSAWRHRTTSVGSRS